VYSYPILDILFRYFRFLAPKDLKIIWLSNLLTLSVPDEGHSRKVSCSFIRYLCVYYLGLLHLHILCSFFCKRNNKAFPIIIYNIITYFVVDFIAHCVIPTGRIICNKLKFCPYVAFRPYPNSENFFLFNEYLIKKKFQLTEKK
jgi:hypothetical protein